MTFKIGWLYYDLLELYGDGGNIKIFCNMLKNNNIDYKLDKITINENRNLEDYDLIMLGGGSDYAQNMLFQDLLGYKEQLQKVLDNKGFILTVCGGYQMFGKYYIGQDGNKIPGLNIFDFYTEKGDKRCTGNVVAECTLGDIELTLVGFENHGGYTKGIDTPLGKAIIGNGNEYEGGFEGCLIDNFIGTYIHGPILPKNPEIGKYIIEYVMKNKYQKEVTIDLSSFKYYKLAKDVVIKREVK
jgi:CobQ-like glutamine amidotransferase family enzyme